MATYADMIGLVEFELRDPEAWPDDASKEDEQLHLLYIAGLAVASVIPLGRLPLAESSAIAGTAQGSAVERHDLNATDLFDLRMSGESGVQDLGIASVRLDGTDYSLDQAIPVPSIQSVGNMDMHSDQKWFAIDWAGELIYTTNVASLTIYHAAKPQPPTATADTYPLQEDSDAQRAVQMVGAHVSGVTIRDQAAAQMQALLQKAYTL